MSANPRDRKTVLGIASCGPIGPICRVGKVSAIEVVGGDEGDEIELELIGVAGRIRLRGPGLHYLDLGPGRLQVHRSKGENPLTLYAIERYVDSTAQ